MFFLYLNDTIDSVKWIYKQVENEIQFLKIIQNMK